MTSPLITDPRDLAGSMVDGTNLIPPPVKVLSGTNTVLIRRKQGESLLAFYTRAERTGIGRQCCRCSGKRKYSMLACPFCGSHIHVEIKGEAGKGKDIELSPDHQPQPDRPLDQPHVSGGGEYTYIPTDPNSEEARDKASEMDAKMEEQSRKQNAEIAAYQGITFGSMDLAGLTEYAKSQGIALGKAKSRSAVLAKIEESVGGFRSSPSADALGESGEQANQSPQ